jgi:hypothetical protein
LLYLNLFKSKLLQKNFQFWNRYCLTKKIEVAHCQPYKISYIMVKRQAPKPHYNLKVIKKAIRSGNYIITPNAADRARKELAMDVNDIDDCILKLRPGDFDKPSYCYYRREQFPVDIYIKPYFRGFCIYLHFYRNSNDETNVVIVDSFHKGNL